MLQLQEKKLYFLNGVIVGGLGFEPRTSAASALGKQTVSQSGRHHNQLDDPPILLLKPITIVYHATCIIKVFRIFRTALLRPKANLRVYLLSCSIYNCECKIFFHSSNLSCNF